MQYITQPDRLIIKLEGLEILWALKRRLQIPRSAIEDVDFTAQQPVLRDLRGYWRLPGTSLPWSFLAGSYRHDGEREFWYLRMKRPGVVTIMLKPDAFRYDRVRISATPQIAQEIADWWRSVPAAP